MSKETADLYCVEGDVSAATFFAFECILGLLSSYKSTEISISIVAKLLLFRVIQAR